MPYFEIIIDIVFADTHFKVVFKLKVRLFRGKGINI